MPASAQPLPSLPGHSGKIAEPQSSLPQGVLYQIFEQAPGFVAITRGPEHRLEYYNPAFQQLYAGRQMLGLPIAETQPEAVRQGFVAVVDEVYTTGKPYQASEVFGRVEDATGGPAQDRYFDITHQAFWENGQIVGVFIMAFDVTERVQLRQQHTYQLAQLRLLFEQAPMAIGILRAPDYIIEVTNPLLGEILGLDINKVIGQSLFEAMPEIRGQGVRTRLDQVVATGKAFVAYGLPLELARNDRLETGYFNFVYQPLRDEQGVLDRIAVVVSEVTEQMRNRERLAQTNKQLYQANKELDSSNQQLTRTNIDLDNFIYSASHDLKAPISNIEGLLVALREELALPPAEADVPPLLDLMKDSVERFKRTISHLTDVTKLQKAHDQPVADVPLTPLIEAVRLDLRQEFADTGAQLHVDVDRCPTIAFSEKNLRSIVYNLLSNALKYRHHGRTPQVWIRCHGAGQQPVLEVQDNGLGLTIVQQQKLFGMFRRLHDHVEGSGIGLYMVKKIIDNAAGRIEVVSEPGVGSTFRVYFPRQD